MLRSSSRSSWQQHSLDLVVEACRTVAPLAAGSAAGRLALEETSFEGALRWLEERPLSPLAELSAHVERSAIKDALINAEIPPSWSSPPEELLERLAQLEEKARVALRMYARASSPSLFVKQAPANQSFPAGWSKEQSPEGAPARVTSPASSGERVTRPVEAVHNRARERLARVKAGLTTAPEKKPEIPGLPSEADAPQRPKRDGRREPASIQLSLHGPSPRRYQRLVDGSILPVFAPATRLVVKANRRQQEEGQQPSALTLLVTSESEAHELTWNEKEEAYLAILDELETGTYCLDLLDSTGVPVAQRFFLVEAYEPALPRMEARVLLEGTESLWEGYLAFGVTLRGEERLELRLPPLWPVRVFWREVSLRLIGRFFADKQGNLDLSERLASMQHLLATTSVADLEVDAGELGTLTLHHDQPSNTEEILARLRELARERAAHLPQGSLELLRTLWIEPICKALGYTVSKPRQRSTQGPLLQELSTLTRSAGQIVRLPYANLWISFTPPSPEDCQQELMKIGPPRILWTDGWRWGRAELGRRHFEWITEVPSRVHPTPLGSVEASLRPLVERIGV